jgi:hypothetical protein
MQVLIEFQWEEVGAVGLSAKGRLDMPSVPASPGIYRFRITTASGTEVHIGESQDLHHRMFRNYANKHRGRTNVRVRAMLLQHIGQGRSIRLEIVSKASLAIDGNLVAADMGSKEARRLIENTALAVARRDGEHIHNL